MQRWILPGLPVAQASASTKQSSPSGQAGTSIRPRRVTAPTSWPKALVTADIAVTSAALAIAILIAVMIDVQSDYLGSRSEATGGFDPTVFPPFFEILWVIGNLFPWLIALTLALLIVALVAVARRT